MYLVTENKKKSNNANKLNEVNLFIIMANLFVFCTYKSVTNKVYLYRSINKVVELERQFIFFIMQFIFIYIYNMYKSENLIWFSTTKLYNLFLINKFSLSLS